MIRIGYVIDTIESPTAGTEKQLLLLLKHLDRSRFDPILCVLRHSRWLKEEFDLCPVYEVGLKSFRSFDSIRKIKTFADYLRRERVDMIQTHFVDGNRAGCLAGRLAGTPVIATCRNQGYWHRGGKLLLQNVLNRWIALFLANSSDTGAWAARTGRIAEERIKVIPNGIDLSRFGDVSPERKRQLRGDLGIAGDAYLAGVLANLRPVKALDVFLRAAALLVKAVPESEFLLAGDGSERSRLKEMAEKLGIADRVHFLGVREDVVPVLHALDVGVLSSSSESFSNSILEYMAAGLPVVCTEVGGVREAVSDGENGFIVPVGDFQALADALSRIHKENLAISMGEKSRRRAERFFGLQVMVRGFEDVYLGLKGAA